MIDWSKPLCFADTTGERVRIHARTGSYHLPSTCVIVRDRMGKLYAYSNTGIAQPPNNDTWRGEPLHGPRPIMNMGPAEQALADKKMVELPRGPIDFKIDGLSQHARRLLVDDLPPDERPRFSISPCDAVSELLKLEFIAVNAAPGLHSHHVTWQGMAARTRILTGAYDHHKEIYAKRAMRFTAEQTHPLYGLV